MSKYKLFIISPEVNDAYRYATQYLKILSSSVSILSTEEQIRAVPQYTVAVAIPFIVNNIGYLSKIATENKNIEFYTAGEANLFGNQFGNILKSTVESCVNLGYSLDEIDSIIKRRLELNFNFNFKFDYRLRIRDRIEMIPMNQPTAAYLLMSTPFMS